MTEAGWRDCLYRPHLCGEREYGDLRDVDGKELLSSWQSAPPLQPPPLPSSAERGLDAGPAHAELPISGLNALNAPLPVRVGRLLRSYWQMVNKPYAGAGDVVVVRDPSHYFVLQQVKRPAVWEEPDGRYMLAGETERRLCIYGFVLSRDIDRIAAELATGRYALVAACDPRAVVRPPRREELYAIWRYEGYVVNTSPAKMALIRLDPAKKPKFAVDFLKSGCPIYSHYLNQILQRAGIPVQLTC